MRGLREPERVGDVFEGVMGGVRGPGLLSLRRLSRDFWPRGCSLGW
jgi:hypothetical protein